MLKKIILFSIVIIGGIGFTVSGQTPAGMVRNSVVTGDVISIDAAKIVLQTKDGELTAALSDKTEYKRVPADNPTAKAAVPATFSEIAVGDKLMVLGIMSADSKTLPAKSVYLMSKSDIAAKQAKEKERWATRGMSGRVTAVNPDTKQITVEVRGMAATATSVVLTPKTDAIYRKYAPNSVTYSESIVSKFGDLQAGDMLRAVGDKSADGASFAAEEIVTGAFQTIAGTVKAIDVEKNEVVITELQSKKDVTVVLGSGSLLKKFPEQMAMLMAARQAGGPGGMAGGQGQGRPGGGQGQTRPAGGQPVAQNGGQTGPGAGPASRGSIDEMLDRFPNITAADLKVGEIIAVSSSKTAVLDRITAIKLLAGVEPFIRAAQATNGNQRQGTQSLNIPGLDGFDSP